MRRILTISMFIMIFATTVTFAAGEYQFEIEYTGDIIANEEKSANVILSATEGPVYNKVQVKSEMVSGPGTPKVIAIDEEGREFDITESGDWGPIEGFQVGGTFSNVTPIKITYPEAGTYVSKISLVDLENDNAVITEKQFTVTVLPQPANAPENNTVDGNNTVEEIPKTGTSVFEYGIYAIIIGGTIFFVYKTMNKNNI